MSFLREQPSRIVHYPDSDGLPIADNTLQFRWITTIEGWLEAQFDNDPNVFVAGDLLWYPVEGHPEIRQAPDILIVFGRPKGDRGSYRQWEEGNIAVTVAWEILSPGNHTPRMIEKFRFCERYGVEEYYMYDPDLQEMTVYVRVGDQLQEVEDVKNWVSPRLGIRFDFTGPEMKILGPDGQPLLTYVELIAQQRDAEREAAVTKEKVESRAAQLRALGIEPTL